MGKHKKQESHEEAGESAPLWIISFADLVALELSFFVILACGAPKGGATGEASSPSASTSTHELNDVAASVKMAFHYVPSVDSTDPIDQIILRRMAGKGDQPRNGDTSEPIDGVIGRNDMVTTVRTGTQTTIGGPISFEEGSVVLKPSTQSSLSTISEMIRGHSNVFLIKGHTSRDEEGQPAAKGRDLAYERATAVMSKLVEMGISRTSLRVQSCRDFEPLKEGAYDNEARALNRRVEVVSTEALVGEYRGQKAEVEAEASPHSPKANPSSHDSDSSGPLKAHVSSSGLTPKNQAGPAASKGHGAPAAPRPQAAPAASKGHGAAPAKPEASKGHGASAEKKKGH